MKSVVPRARVLELVLAHGRDAMSFMSVESGMQHWLDDAAPDGTGGCVAYVDVGSAWVAACGPLVGETARGQAARRFIAAARAAEKRGSFFACEALDGEGLERLLLGEQPIFRPREWLRDLGRHRRLREQLRRARAKGLRVRRVEPAELHDGTPLRREVTELSAAWLRTRPMEPMAFLVALEPFLHPAHHRYFVAEVEGKAVAFLSAVPIGWRNAWLVEDVVRGADAPNGTTETLLAALMEQEIQSEFVTLGLTPLAGPVAWPLRLARWVARPLFDFEGLRAFRARLRPQAWEPVWLAFPRGASPALSIVDGLRAFARGSLAEFATRSLLRHPSGVPWALALPLPVWTAILAGLVVMHRAWLLGFPRAELSLWVVFDALLLVVLVGAAMNPRRHRLVLAAALASIDAALSVGHVLFVGAGSSAVQTTLRACATIAPLAGAPLLTRAAWQTVAPRSLKRPSRSRPAP